MTATVAERRRQQYGRRTGILESRLVRVDSPGDHDGILVVTAETPGHPIVDVHLSGLYKLDFDVFAAYVAEVVAVEEPDRVSITEIYGPGRAAFAALEAVLDPKVWAVRWRGEYVFAMRRTRFRFEGKARVRRVTYQWGASSDRWKDYYRFEATTVDKETGDVHDEVIAHRSGGTEAGTGYRRGVDREQRRKNRSHRRGLRKDGRRRRRIQRRHPGRVFNNRGDWNVSYRMEEWRRRGRNALGMPSCWDRNRPKHGTHAGDRLIDVFHTDAGLKEKP